MIETEKKNRSFSIDMIEFSDMTFGFEGHDLLFEKVNCWFPLNENVWVTSQGEPGRTSLLKILAGLYQPSEGQFFINDLNITDMSFEEFLPYRLRIGYAFDNLSLISNRSLLQNITLPLRYHDFEPPDEANRFAKELLDIFEVGEYADERPASVTPSVQKCAILARAFVLKPEMIILDDPDDSMDTDQLKNLVKLIKIARQYWGLKHVFFSARRKTFGELLATVEFEIKNKSLIYRKRVRVDQGSVA